MDRGEAFVPLTTLLVVGVLALGRPDLLRQAETEALAMLGEGASPSRLYGWLFALLVVAVGIARGGGWLLSWYRGHAEQRKEKVQTAARERAALTRLYEGLGGSKWHNQQNWCTSAELFEWKGVYMNHATNRVTKLVLPHNNLECEDFSTAGAPLSDLTHLVELDFRGNNLRGTLPASLGTLRRMQGLYLYENFLSGDIPHSLILNLKHSLQGIYLFNNNFTNSAETRKACEDLLNPNCLIYV
jgi:hypothetical protein